MAKSVPHCPLEMRASDADNAKGGDYFSENADKIKADLLKYGAIWFRGYDLMKSVKGHREFYEKLGLDPCLDPLHSSGLRKFASERDALYEEVSFQLDFWSHSRIFTAITFELTNLVTNIPSSLTLSFQIILIVGKQAIPPWTLHWPS